MTITDEKLWIMCFKIKFEPYYSVQIGNIPFFNLICCYIFLLGPPIICHNFGDLFYPLLHPILYESFICIVTKFIIKKKILLSGRINWTLFHEIRFDGYLLFSQLNLSNSLSSQTSSRILSVKPIRKTIPPLLGE